MGSSNSRLDQEKWLEDIFIWNYPVRGEKNEKRNETGQLKPNNILEILKGKKEKEAEKLI